MNEEARLLDGGELQGIVEFIVVVQRRRGRTVVRLAEIEPVVRERVDKAARLRVVEQAVGLGSQDFGIAEPALRG